MTIKSKVVAVGLEGTLCEEVCWTPKQVLEATPIGHAIRKVNKIEKHHIVIIYTDRKDELIVSTLQWLRKHRVHYNAISNKKIGADYFVDDLDDKAVSLTYLVNNLNNTGWQ